MTIRTVFTINTILALLFGLAFLLLPEFLTSVFGIAFNSGTGYIAQLLGAALIGLAIVVWLAKDTQDPQSVRALLVGLLVFNVVGAVVSLLAVLTGVTNALGWLLVAVFLVEALPRVYFLTTDRSLTLQRREP